ncbi:hypothetical protein [Gemmobacter denitrificans]|uniref:Uncharacterized protein n=1 Tax=Gemmobacter denitrificans TaxID=3123040 RepID=A0ABU8BSU2_9RHOB
MSLFAVLADILFVGHSLVGPNLPGLVEQGLIQQGAAEAVVEAQIINGAPLRYQWDNSTEAEGVDARVRLVAGGVDALILTEAIPLAGQIDWNDSPGQVASWAGLAWEHNPATQVFIYETWHSLKSAPGAAIEGDPGAGIDWATRIAADLPAWEGLVTGAEAIRPQTAPPLRLIPAGQAMALARAEALAGRLPGIARIEDLFSDDIHPNGKGQYLLAMVHVAAISGKSPEGLPARLGRRWTSRDAVISDELALALQRIAWTAVQAQVAREAARPATAKPDMVAAALPEPEAAPADPATAELAALPPPVSQDAIAALTPIINPSLGFGLAGVNDWTVQQPFLDVMKTARPWTGHKPGQWGGIDHDGLAAGGWLDGNGWVRALPPGIEAVSTLVLTELPADAGGIAGRYVLRWRGKGDLRLEGRAQNISPVEGGLAFDYTPGEGSVLITLSALDATDPIRDMTLVREDRLAAFDAGHIFNPDWLNRLRGVRLIRFMDWMATNNATLATIEDSPKPSDYTWARNGVPVEVMVALANELEADPWFTLPHLSSDAMVRFYAESVADLLMPGLKAHVELSNEVWNWQFTQSAWAEAEGKARWGRDGAWLQFYALRATQVARIWTEAFGAEARDRLVRVIATQTGVPGMEVDILDAPLVKAEGDLAPYESFDAYAVTGYFAGLMVTDVKLPLVKQWLAESAQADPANPYALAVTRAAEELRDGRHSGIAEDTLQDVLTRILPYQAKVAKDRGLDLVMYEGGSHLVGIGPIVDDAEVVAFLQHLSYTPEMGALYSELLQGWAALTDQPFNAFVDIYTPGKWGSWGALRHLGDDNPRWRVLARGCDKC